MKKTLIAVLASATLLSGCASSFNSATTAELSSAKTQDLCEAYNYFKEEKVKQELQTRPEITHWDAIEADRVTIGMNEMELVCSKGLPMHINRTTHASGVRKQLVYRYYDALGNKRRNYVYTSNGTVTSYQN